MIADIKKIECKESINILRQILKNWIKINEGLAKLWESEGYVPWW